MIICIGREFGSGGHEIGKLTAEKLGITFYDRELIEEAAACITTIPKETIQKADERKHNPWMHRVWLSDGELREKQTANYFSDIYPIDCAVLSANAQSYPKCCTLLAVLLSA
jgi:hypothetical protein